MRTRDTTKPNKNTLRQSKLPYDPTIKRNRCFLATDRTWLNMKEMALEQNISISELIRQTFNEDK